MRALVLAISVLVTRAAGYDIERFNWDGSPQLHGRTGDVTPIELGEQHEISMSSNPVEEHNVIELYEDNNWGWPGKDSPENQMPGTWKSTRGTKPPEELGEVPVKKWETDPRVFRKMAAKKAGIKLAKPEVPAAENSAHALPVDAAQHTPVDFGVEQTGTKAATRKADVGQSAVEVAPAAVDTRSAQEKEHAVMEQKLAAVGAAEPGSNILKKSVRHAASEQADVGDAAPEPPTMASQQKQTAPVKHAAAAAAMKKEPKQEREKDQAMVRQADAARAAAAAHPKPVPESKVDPGRGEAGFGRNKPGVSLDMAGQNKQVAEQVSSIRQQYGKAFASLVGTEGIPTGNKVNYGPGTVAAAEKPFQHHKPEAKAAEKPAQAASKPPPPAVNKHMTQQQKNELHGAESFVKYFTGESQKDIKAQVAGKAAWNAEAKKDGASVPIKDDSINDEIKSVNNRREDSSASDVHEAVLKNPNSDSPHYRDAASHPLYDMDSQQRNSKTGIVSKAGIVRDQQIQEAAKMKAAQGTANGKQLAKQIIPQPRVSGQQLMAKWHNQMAKQAEAKKAQVQAADNIAQQKKAHRTQSQAPAAKPQSENWAERTISKHGGLPDADAGFAAIAKEYHHEQMQGHDPAADPETAP